MITFDQFISETMVYNFKRKVAGQWEIIKDRNGIPIEMQATTRNPVKLFRLKFPSISTTYPDPDQIAAEPNLERMKELDFHKQELQKRDQEAIDRARRSVDPSDW